MGISTLATRLQFNILYTAREIQTNIGRTAIGISVKFKQNIVLCSGLSCATSKTCISGHPRKWLRIFVLSLSLPLLRSQNSDTRVCTPEDHLLWPCLESRERSCTFECIQFMSKEDSVHKFYCLQKNGCLLPVSKRIQLNCRTMNLLI